MTNAERTSFRIKVPESDPDDRSRGVPLGHLQDTAGCRHFGHDRRARPASLPTAAGLGAAKARRPKGHNHAPTGVDSGSSGVRRLAERDNTITHWRAGNPGGGHVVPMDRPEPYAPDLRVFFQEAR